MNWFIKGLRTSLRASANLTLTFTPSSSSSVSIVVAVAVVVFIAVAFVALFRDVKVLLIPYCCFICCCCCCSCCCCCCFCFCNCYYNGGPGYCWIGLLECSIRIVIQFCGLDCDWQSKVKIRFWISIVNPVFFISIQIQNIRIILLRN